MRVCFILTAVVALAAAAQAEPLKLHLKTGNWECRETQTELVRSGQRRSWTRLYKEAVSEQDGIQHSAIHAAVRGATPPGSVRCRDSYIVNTPSRVYAESICDFQASAVKDLQGLSLSSVVDVNVVNPGFVLVAVTQAQTRSGELVRVSRKMIEGRWIPSVKISAKR